MSFVLDTYFQVGGSCCLCFFASVLLKQFRIEKIFSDAFKFTWPTLSVDVWHFSIFCWSFWLGNLRFSTEKPSAAFPGNPGVGIGSQDLFKALEAEKGMGILATPPPQEGLIIRPYEGKPMGFHKPLIRPYFLGGLALGAGGARIPIRICV